MPKYINADDWSYDSTITQAKFTNISDVLSYFNGLYGKNKSVDQMIEKLEIDLINMPSADVVEVVRCRDCEHYCNGNCNRPAVVLLIAQEDDYCSYGERKVTNE